MLKAFWITYLPLLFAFAYISYKSKNSEQFFDWSNKLAIFLTIVFAGVMLRFAYIIFKIFFDNPWL